MVWYGTKSHTIPLTSTCTIYFITLLLALQSDQSLHMTHNVICRLCCALAHIEAGLPWERSVLVYIFYEICAYVWYVVL